MRLVVYEVIISDRLKSFFVHNKMIAQTGQHNTLFGQFEEESIALLKDLRFDFKDSYVLFSDETGDKVRMFLDNGLIKYQVYDGVNWTPSQSLTNPGSITPEDSVTLPHNPANTRIQIDNDQFRVFLQNTLYMNLTNSILNIRTQSIEINNDSYDLLIKMKSALGQVLRIQDQDSGSSLLELSAASVDVMGK